MIIVCSTVPRTRPTNGDQSLKHSSIRTRRLFLNCLVSSYASYLKFISEMNEHVFSPAKFSTAPSANIFANKEYEMLQRSLNVRRLSFALFTGDKNQFLTQLPMIQEKLVDILRNVPAPIVQSEVFLCIRVLLCRLSAHNLTSLWPVILTELVSVQK